MSNRDELSAIVHGWFWFVILALSAVLILACTYGYVGPC